MEQFYLEEPSIERKEQALEYIEEHIKYKSNINGDSGLDKSYKNYEDWLIKTELMKNPETCPISRCPGYTYFLIRENDNKIIGMISIRYNLNEVVLKYGGHIGYGIRPTERKKGYNKVNLYLGLLKAQEIGIDRVLLTAVDTNPASFKTILSLDGVLENKIQDDEDENVLLGRYWINVKESLNNHYDEYKDKMYIKEKRK